MSPLAQQPASKSPAESKVVSQQIMLPTHANPMGNVHGGVLMKFVDEVGAIAAMKHAQRPVVTVALDSMTFLSPVHVGDLVTFEATVCYVGRTSMAVEVRVIAENPLTREPTHTNTAHLAYVALDENERPFPVPTLELNTDEEQQRWDDAKERQQRRLRETRRGKNANA